MHFFYKERHSAVLAFSNFCQYHASVEDAEPALQFVRNKVLNIDIHKMAAQHTT